MILIKNELKIVPMAFGIRLFQPLFVISYFGATIIGLIIPFFVPEFKNNGILTTVITIITWFILWNSFLWLFFYIWCWKILAKNAPIKITENENNIVFEYDLWFMNKKFDKNKIQWKYTTVFGTNILKIKENRKLIGYLINMEMYE